MVVADDDIVDADGWAADGVARVLTSGDEVRFSAEQFGLVSADAARPELNIVKIYVGVSRRAEEHMPHDSKFVGSNPARCWAFSSSQFSYFPQLAKRP